MAGSLREPCAQGQGAEVKEGVTAASACGGKAGKSRPPAEGFGPLDPPTSVAPPRQFCAGPWRGTPEGLGAGTLCQRLRRNEQIEPAHALVDLGPILALEADDGESSGRKLAGQRL